MSGRVLLDVLQRQSSLSYFRSLNYWRHFSRRSFSTAQKMETSTVKSFLTEAKEDVHNKNVPTYEEIKNTPELQRILVHMYKFQKVDPDFQKLIFESMKWGIRSFGKE